MSECTPHGFLDDETKECQKCKYQSNDEGFKIGKVSTCMLPCTRQSLFFKNNTTWQCCTNIGITLV